jgi:histidinol phosphatase-like enzyme
MGLQAQKEYPEINFSKSIMVGDTDSDILFGKNLGMKTVRIKTVEPINIEADLTCLTLLEFSEKIKL